MKIIFNDATELSVQQAEIGNDGVLRIKVLQKTEEEIREIFGDEFRTKRMQVVSSEAEEILEEYTDFQGVTKYNDGVLEPFLYKKGKSEKELLEKALKENKELKEKVSVLNKCMLEISELVYQ